VPKISFEMESVTVDVPDGATIWDAAGKARIVLQRGFAAVHPCPGRGICSGTACAVFLRTGDPRSAVSPPTWREKLFHRRIFKSGKRLACQTVPKRDLTVVTMP
jgi:ferredoxin